MKKTVKEGLLRGLSAVFASLFVLMLCLTSVAQDNVGIINRELGTTSYITVSTGDSVSDTAYYKAEFRPCFKNDKAMCYFNKIAI
ncbi:MAG: hypothetical protein J1F18_15665, partial [Lachnospiraceae bacterium]|nr:hypothetical protein [Lachnospiraceae bacterium]